MDTCLWNDKLVMARDISNSYELETKIRIASGHKELMCPDPQCEAIMIYRHGEKKEAHFAHLKKSDACDYDEYDRGNNEYIKKVKKTLYNHFTSLGYDIQMDVKLLEHHYTHLTISFIDGSRIALELGTKAVTANHIEKISKQYFDKNITVRWIVIDKIETDLKESQTYYIKRSSLNESENRDLIVIDFEADNVAQYKMDLDKYQYNNNDFYPVSNQNPYKYVSNISQLTILNKDIALSGFNKLYERWKQKKQTQLLSSIEEIEIEKKRREKFLNFRLSATESPEIKAEVKHNNLRKSTAKTQAYKPDEEPFILEKITIPRTKSAFDRTMFYKWSEDDFKEKIKMAVDEDITAVKMLISKVFECDENELSIFISLLAMARSAPQNLKTVKCIKIIEHVLKQARRNI